ncbi:ankyrin repeat domain-containing protein 62-like isoform X2 [Dipodomys merriami]|uniref:ankyrin repeat domain-containing protein 62-like isoform X2 n=1 Tax=Dipodomys merriami TaxID=94247 RepID=UPI0038558737
MKTNFVLRSEHQNCCGSSADPRRSVLCCASENVNAKGFDSARYLSRYKASGKIHKAASQGDVGKVQRKLLGGKNDVNARDKKNRTALHYACAYGHLAIVALLIEKCEIDICDSDNSTALIKDGLTPLLLALKENKQQMAEFLIENKANIHAVDELNRSALMYAVQCESKYMVKFLLQQGVDVFLKDAFGCPASYYALGSHCNVIKKTLSKYEENVLSSIPCNYSGKQNLEVMLEEEQKKPDGRKNIKSQVKHKKKQHKRNEMKISLKKHCCEAPAAVAADADLDEDGSAPLGNGSHKQFLIKGNGEHKSAPFWTDMEVKESGSENWTSGNSVSIHENPTSITSDLLQMTDGCCSDGIDEGEGRLKKKTSKHTHKVRKQIHSLEDHDDLALSCETETDDYSGCPLNFKAACPSCDKLMKHKNSHCEVPSGKKKKLKHKVKGMRKGLSKMHLYSVSENNELDKLCNFRLKRKTSKEKHKIIKPGNVMKDLNDSGPSTEPTADHYAGGSLNLVDLLHSCDRLIECKTSQYELLSRKIKIMENEVRGPQEELLDIEVKSPLEEGEMEPNEICHMRILSQQDDLKKENDDQNFGNTETILRAKEKHNEEEEIKQLQTYVRKLYVEVKDLKLNWKQISDVKEKLDNTSSKYPHLKENIQCVEQDILSIKSIQKEWEHLERNQEDLEEHFLNFKNLIQEYMKQIEDHENLKQLSDCNNDSTISEMILSLKDLEIELFKMKAESQFIKSEVKKYNQLFTEEVKTIKSLLSELKNTEEELEAASRKYLLKEEQKRSVQSSHFTRGRGSWQNRAVDN